LPTILPTIDHFEGPFSWAGAVRSLYRLAVLIATPRHDVGVGRTAREAPVFYGIFAGLLALGALVALIPGLSLVEVILVAQVINGILLPILLVFILRLVNDKRLMGRYTNSRWQNVVAWGTMVLLSALSIVLLASIFLPLAGVRFLS
jgi:Natural resistance-associated macrophage protein